MTRKRLDLVLVEQGLCASRTQASQLISEKQVLVNGAVALKVARKVSPQDNITLVGPKPRYVSRAGAKLEGALEYFDIDPSGKNCLDVGSSTGGFTDCLLQHGAKHVTAVDVGTNQLHESMRSHSQVSVHEKTDIRKFAGSYGDESPYDLIVCDVSFISVTKILHPMFYLGAPGTQYVLLIKPQFEAGREIVSKGNGIVSDPEVWLAECRKVVAACLELGLEVIGIKPSPIKGTEGNVEFVLGLVR